MLWMFLVFGMGVTMWWWLLLPGVAVLVWLIWRKCCLGATTPVLTVVSHHPFLRWELGGWGRKNSTIVSTLYLQNEAILTLCLGTFEAGPEMMYRVRGELWFTSFEHREPLCAALTQQLGDEKLAEACVDSFMEVLKGLPFSFSELYSSELCP